MTEVTEKVKEKAGGGDDGGGGLTSKLVVPVAAAAGTLVSGYAAKKVPELLREHVLPRLEQKGDDEAEGLGRKAVEGAKGAVEERGGIAGKVAGKMLGGGDDDDSGDTAKGWGRGRRLPIQCSVDVAVPVDVAYNQWTQFTEFPSFMHRVEEIEQKDDSTLVWHENIWHVRRSWKSEIVEQRPNERIVWHSKSRGGHSGVITFHPLSDRLTRIEVNIDFQPEGMFEKLSSGLRFHRRAIRSDLQRFKAFVEMRGEETGEWRGEIHEEEKNPALSEPQDEHDEQDDQDDQDDEGRGESDGSRDGDPEAARKEREQRRRERQKAMSS
jgi:uncharacterized membrane protein